MWHNWFNRRNDNVGGSVAVMPHQSIYCFSYHWIGNAGMEDIDMTLKELWESALWILGWLPLGELLENMHIQCVGWRCDLEGCHWDITHYTSLFTDHTWCIMIVVMEAIISILVVWLSWWKGSINLELIFMSRRISIGIDEDRWFDDGRRHTCGWFCAWIASH